MKKILYIITTSSLEDISSVMSGHDSSEGTVQVLFTQEGVRCAGIDSLSCLALQEDLLVRHLKPSCPTIGYKDMVNLIFESDLVITV